MSEATRAKNASERATIFLRKLKAGQKGTRSFNDCLEMNDADTVVRIVLERAAAKPEIEALLRSTGYEFWLKPGYLKS